MQRKGFCMICSMKSCVKASFTGPNSSYQPNSVVKNLKSELSPLSPPENRRLIVCPR